MTSTTKHIDLIVHADAILTVDAQDRVLEQHSLLVHNSRIVGILPQQQVRQAFTADQVMELPGHALMPGLINAHTHSAMNLMRGIADDMPLMQWLQEHIWPVEQRIMSAGFVHDGSRLAMAEMLRSGTTCFNDMYFFPDEVGRAAAHIGMRATLGLIVIDFPTVWAQDGQDYLRKGLQIHDQFRDDPLVHTAFAPHAPYSVSDVPLEKIVTYAEELDIPIHMHIHETADEVDTAVKETGKRPLERLEQLGLLTPRLLAVHMTALNQAEIDRVVTSGSHVVHCPESNMKLASGICPVQTLLDAGINVALGTDGAASNNDLDMLGEMRSAALLAKIADRNACSLNAHSVLRMATINGARALGVDDQIGSLETDKQADFIAIDLDQPETRPLYDPCAQIVYAAGREQVRHVWVAGKQLLRDRQLLTLDEKELLENTAQWQERIWQTNQKG
ncbi:MAG: TRZ/ATZ family hydrolase [Granulosicoccaceae bacterium]|jgi:5-methylthioadenosine/S-adenosylhomocysteine deaminase